MCASFIASENLLVQASKHANLVAELDNPHRGKARVKCHKNRSLSYDFQTTQYLERSYPQVLCQQSVAGKPEQIASRLDDLDNGRRDKIPANTTRDNNCGGHRPITHKVVGLACAIRPRGELHVTWQFLVHLLWHKSFWGFAL